MSGVIILALLTVGAYFFLKHKGSFGWLSLMFEPPFNKVDVDKLKALAEQLEKEATRAEEIRGYRDRIASSRIRIAKAKSG